MASRSPATHGLAVALFAAVLGVAGTAAAADDRAACLEAISRANADLTSFTARVVQTKKLALLEQPLESRGRLAFERPDRIAWEIVEPEPLRVVIDGARISLPGVDEPALRSPSDPTVPRHAPPPALAHVPLLSRLGDLFTGNVAALEESFEIEAACEGESAELTLRPRTAELAVSVALLRVDLAGPRLLVRSIRMRNGVGDTLELRVDDVARNAPVPASTFELDRSSP